MIFDVEAISKEYLKCLTDTSRIYMITHYLKTYDATQRKEVPFHLFPRQQDLCNTLGNAENVVTTKPRQAGITTTSGAFIACEMCLADPDSPQTVLCIGNTLDLAQQMLFKIRDFLLQFPIWMWGMDYVERIGDPFKLPNKNDIFTVCNSKELRLKNGCKVVARSSGPDASRGVGGVTWLIFDEAAFIENGKDVYASALPTVSTGGHIIMISTPNGMDQLYYETCRRAELKGTRDWNSFELVKMKWFEDPRYNKCLEWYRKDEESGELIIEAEEKIDNQGNVKYTPEAWKEREKEGWKARSPWYIKMCEQFNHNPQKIAQELDVSFLGSDSTVVDPKAVEMQENLNMKEPDRRYADPMLEDTWVWKPPIEGHRYIMAIDNSRGDSDDATALEIIDLDGIDDDGNPCIEQVLEYNGKLYGDVVGEIAYNYGMLYNCAFCVVEDIGGYGSATILKLMDLKYPNMYYDDPNLKNYTADLYASSLPSGMGDMPGFKSNAVRFQMLSYFANLVKTNQFKVRSKRVISELRTWIFKNGKMDHKDGCHDDTLTCLAMGLFVMEYSINKFERGKHKDAAMLNAMISINSRIRYNENGFKSKYLTPQDTNNTTKKKYAMPVYVNSVSLNQGKSAAYKASMWLFK